MSRLELSFKLKEREILRIFHGYLEDFVEGLKSFVENFVVVFIKDFFKDLFQRCRLKLTIDQAKLTRRALLLAVLDDFCFFGCHWIRTISSERRGSQFKSAMVEVEASVQFVCDRKRCIERRSKKGVLLHVAGMGVQEIYSTSKL